MRLIASDLITNERPSRCDLRVWLRHQGQPQRDSTAYEEVLHKLGEKHEREHVTALGKLIDFSGLEEEERVQKTLQAIAAQTLVLYQPIFRVIHRFGIIETEILGIPDFMIL